MITTIGALIMPKHKHINHAGDESSLSLFPPLPSVKDERELQQTAYQLKLCYKSLDDGDDSYIKKADNLKKLFIAKYRALHFGETPHENFMEAISYYASQYETYLEQKNKKPVRKFSHALASMVRPRKAQDEYAETLVPDEFSKILKTLDRFKPSNNTRLAHQPTKEDFISITKAADELKTLYVLLDARFHDFTDVAYKTERLFTLLHQAMFGDALTKQNFLQEVDRFSTHDVSFLPREVEMKSFARHESSF